MTIPERRVARLEVVERFDDELGWLIRRTLTDSVARARPAPEVWQRIQQWAVVDPSHRWQSLSLRWWRRWQDGWASIHAALESSANRRDYHRDLFFYQVGAPLLMEPQSRVWA